MIVPLKHVTLLCVVPETEQTLTQLRDLGVMHLNLGTAESASFHAAQKRLQAVREAQNVLQAAVADKPVTPTVAAAHKGGAHEKTIGSLIHRSFPSLSGDAASRVDAILLLADMRQQLVDEIARLEHEIACYKHFGDFDLSLHKRLGDEGFRVRFVRRHPNSHFEAPENAFVQTLAEDKDYLYGVLVGEGELCETCEELDPPEASIAVMRQQLEQAVTREARIAHMLKQTAAHADDLEQEAARLTDESDFANAVDTMQAEEAVSWITGWLPAKKEKVLRDAATEHAWGLLLRDPDKDERPPTLLRPPRIFRPVLALFEGLGISPAYHEADVSVPFFCFFSIFFAMLVGDGGYGALIFLLAWQARKKMPKAPAAPFVLLYFFAFATVIWGVLTNTWFGTHPAFANNETSLWLNDPEKGINNTMLVCFTLGVLHLSVARIWNAIQEFPDTKALAQVGWIGVVWFMYCMTCQVVGIFQAPTLIYPVFGVSVLLILLFTLKRHELKTQGIELGMMPLTIVGCLGDIISYVRLFAVGLASVKVAENFNDMAIKLDLPMWLKIVPMLLILLVGHGLNFAMAGLSILVHAVRLNTLEFSNHKGITWSGFAFKPFRKNVDAC